MVAQARPKPVIVVLSEDDDDGFTWVSGGWFESSIQHTPEAQRLMALAHENIDAGTDVLDVITRLEAAGFKIARNLIIVEGP